MPKSVYPELVNNLTFDKQRKEFRYRDPITKKRTWYGKDEAKAKEKAKKANAIAELIKEQADVNRGKAGTVRHTIRLYKEIVLPNKPWSKNTVGNKHSKLNAIDREFGTLPIGLADQIVIGDHLNRVGTSGDTYMKWREVWCDLCGFCHVTEAR